MKTFTHEQVQEILRSGAEAPDDDRAALAEHLSGCADCRSYAALVTELGQVVPGMNPVPSLSKQEIHRIVSTSQSRLRRQSMLTMISRGTRTVVGLGAILALFVIFFFLAPRLLPKQSSGNPTLTPLASVNSSPTPFRKATPKPGESIEYTVIEEESLFSIAEKFGLKPETILWANPDVLADNPANVRPGIVLRIPSVDGLYYRWKAGDTIEMIASRYGVTPLDVLNWPENTVQIGPAEKPNIQPGMLLFIPGGKMPLQPAPILPAASTPTSTRDAGGLELSALLKIFPLAPGASWVYTETTYTQTGDPNQIIRAVTSIEDQVADVQNLPPYYVAHIQREASLVSADPGFLEYNGTKTTPGSSEFWYILHAGRVYQSNARPDPANLALDQLSEELDFPLTVGSVWCPNKIQKGSLTPEAETPVPCASSAGVRKVLAEESYSTQTGKFEPCYRMSDFYNSGSPIKVFCDGVGIVAEKFDHAGSRFGYSKELVAFSIPPAFLTTITPTAPAADLLQISAGVTWGKGAITAAAYSPDGKRLGVVTTLGVYIYDAGSLAQLDFIPYAAAWPAVAFSPDWSLLALGSGSSVSLLRLADGVEIAHLETGQGRVVRLLFSPDGRYLASLVQPPGEEVYTKMLEMWGVTDGMRLNSWEAGVMPQLAFTPDSQSLYVWYPDTMAGTQHWQIPSGDPLPVRNEIFPKPVAFAPDGNLDISTGPITDSPVMRVRSLADGARLPTFIWEQAGFSGSLFTSSDGALLVGLGSDGLGKVWRTKDGTVLSILNTSVAKGQVMSISPDGQTIVVSAADGLVFYNLSTGKISQRLQSHPQSIRQAALSQQGDRVAALIGDSDPEKISLAVWSYPQEQPIYLLPRIAAVAALDLAWSPPGEHLALASWDGRVLILNASDGILVQTLPGHAQQVQSVAWSPDGTQIASSSFSVKVWRASDGALLSDLGGSGQWITGLTFSPDGKLLAGADAAGMIDVWDLQAKTRIAQLPVTVSSDARGIAIAPDGKTLVAAEGADLWFYRLADFQLFLHVQGQSGAQVISLAIAPDGAWLACGLTDGTVQIRALPGGSLLRPLDGGSDAISSLDFSSDGKTLLAASRDGTLRFWSINK